MILIQHLFVTPNYAVMNEERRLIINAAGIFILLVLLIIYGFYIHRNEPHWQETFYVRIVK